MLNVARPRVLSAACVSGSRNVTLPTVMLTGEA